MKINTKYNHLLSFFLLFTLAVSVMNEGFAKSSQDIGREILQEASDRDSGFGDMTAHVTMILKDPDGDQHTRHLLVKSLEIEADGEKRLFAFSRPRDIKGTTVLNFGHILEEDDQWIYLPAFKRVKRISSANKSSAFVSSEFAYEDLTSVEVDKYRHNYLGDAKINDLDCFKVELIPVYENSGYSRQVAYIDKQDYQFRKVEFFDLQGALLKTLVLQGYQQYKQRYWRPDVATMTNHQSNKVTVMLWDDIQLQTGLSDADFNRNAIKRIR